MKILGWDTSSQIGCIVAYENGSRCEWRLDLGLKHSERLLWGIDNVLKACQWELEDVHGFAVGVGPGSFTGLRIGVTTARSLGVALQKPLLEISSLKIAHNSVAPLLSELKESFLVWVAQDACKGEVFESYFKSGSKTTSVEKVTPIEEFEKKVKKLVSGKKNLKKIFLGNAWDRIPSLQKIKAHHTHAQPVGPSGLIIEIQNQLKHGKWKKPQDVTPQYLRISDAEKKLKEGKLKQSLAFLS